MYTNHNVTSWGRTQSLSAWSRELKINRNTIRNRLNAGQSLEEIIANPPQWLHLVSAKGVTKPVGRWATDFGVTVGAVIARLNRGQTMEQIADVYSRRS